MNIESNVVRTGWMRWLLPNMLIYAILFLVFYPRLSGIEDEIGFVNQAMVWSRGVLSSEAAGFPDVTDFGKPGETPHLVDFVKVGDRHLPGRHPGRSLLLLPFLMVGGVKAGFVSGLLIHLGVTIVAGLLLNRLGRSAAWALLVLYHPTLALYSRTIMGDEAAGCFLLLAALCSTYKTSRGAIAAGLAVGLAALCRYHAGLGLLAVMPSISFDQERQDRRRDGLLCLLAGGLCGLLLIVYNLALYHSALDPVGAPRGQFGFKFVGDNLPFYGMALMSVWPGMLLAPALDRSAIRWISRGTCGIFLIFFCLYYFHDRGSSLAETLVLGLRLIQVALPIWIVSYAVVLDQMLNALRPKLSSKSMTIGLAMLVAVMVLATTYSFRKHDRHLQTLEMVREAMVTQIPSGSVVVTHGASYKMFGIPSYGPVYRWLMFLSDATVFDHSKVLDSIHEPWYFAVLVKGDPALPPSALLLIEKYGMKRVEQTPPALMLYRADPSGRAPQ